MMVLSTAPALDRWDEHLKDGDVLWTNPTGHHFFHYFFPEQTGRQIIKFWQRIDTPSIIISPKSTMLEEICRPYTS